ncbi:MAG TPA: hypothetical protein VEY96_05595 [Actinomycetes bacterium]|nr:hypothetical protein [Actinomycetes bacterium]
MAASSAVTRAVVTDHVPGTPVPFTLATLGFAAVSMVGFFLGVLAIWSAIKSWLRDDLLSLRARWGARPRRGGDGPGGCRGPLRPTWLRRLRPPRSRSRAGAAARRWRRPW